MSVRFSCVKPACDLDRWSEVKSCFVALEFTHSSNFFGKPKRVGIHQNVASLPETIYMNGLGASRKLSEPNTAGDVGQRSWWSLSSCPSIKGDRHGDEASQSRLLVVDCEKVWSQAVLKRSHRAGAPLRRQSSLKEWSKSLLNSRALWENVLNSKKTTARKGLFVFLFTR